MQFQVRGQTIPLTVRSQTHNRSIIPDHRNISDPSVFHQGDRYGSVVYTRFLIPLPLRNGEVSDKKPSPVTFEIQNKDQCKGKQGNLPPLHYPFYCLQMADGFEELNGSDADQRSHEQLRHQKPGRMNTHGHESVKRQQAEEQPFSLAAQLQWQSASPPGTTQISRRRRTRRMVKGHV